jgi:dTDP-4-dehydrorhamnose 3,5-epimerase
MSIKYDKVKIINNKSYIDNRGYFKEILLENNLKKRFPFVVMSFSKKNVLRGLHIQMKKSQGKFISVLKGAIFDVVLDLRKNSKTFGNYFTFILSEKNSKSLYVPPGFAHGFCTLNEENYIIYSCTNYRHKESEISINFNDKDLNIKWPSKNPIVSKKDKLAMSFSDFKKKYR